MYAESHGHPQIFCVDTWEGSRADRPDSTTKIAKALGPRTIFKGFCRNMGHLLCRNVFPCVGKSETWAEIWPFSVAAVFVDAGHDYESVMQDLKGWWPHVLPGGLFCGHDYELFPGVKRAVTEWANEIDLIEPLCHDEELWWVWKPNV
jgi:hypothetical protein